MNTTIFCVEILTIFARQKINQTNIYRRMKNFFYLTLLAVALLFSPACDTDPAGVDEKNETVTILATLENGREWNAGDEVVINGSKYTVEVGGKSTVSIENVVAADYYYAAYDFGRGSVDGTVLNVELPSIQGPSISTIKPMVASNGTTNLVFKNLLGTLRIKLEGSGSVSRVVISSLDGAIAGQGTANMDFAGAPIVDVASDGNRSITIDLGKQVTLPTEVDVVLPAITYSGFSLTAYGADDAVMSGYTIPATEILRGDVRNVVVEFEANTESSVYVTATLENAADGSAHTWSGAAELYVNGTPAFLAGGQGTATADFGPVVEADIYYASTSSASANGMSGSSMRISVPSTQRYNAALSTINPAVAKSTTNNLALEYLGGVATVNISGPHILRSVSLIGKENRRLAGSGVVDMSTNTARLSLNSDASKEIKVDCGTAGVNIENGATFRFVLPADDYSEGFTLSMLDTNGQPMTVEIAGGVISRNTITALENVVWESEQGDGNNLSKLGYANCYMVHMAGDYSFKTRKIDNTPINNIAKVDWLWVSTVEGVEGNALVSNVKYENNTVTFTASDYKGNALLAAFDAAGQIIWSWHIWMTDKPEVYDYMNNFIEQSGGKTDGYYCMDRNLGATSATLRGGYETFGLYYQWGRKDPFIGDKQEEREQEYVEANGRYEWVEKVKPFGNSDKLTICNTAYSQAKWVATPTNSQIGTIEYAAANPMTFLTGGTGSVANWLDLKTLDENIKNNIMYEPDLSLWRPFQKSNYDPCPPGYQVPRYAMWVCLVPTNSVYDDYGFVNTTDGGIESWFPSSGCRSAHPTDGGSLIKVQKSSGCAYLWSSEMQASEMSRRFYYHAPYFDATQAAGWGNGYNVRCVKNY